MGLILPIRNRGFATCADDALHPEFWEPYRPSFAFCGMLGRTGSSVFDYSNNKILNIVNYTSNIWSAKGLIFDYPSSSKYATINEGPSLPFTVIFTGTIPYDTTFKVMFGAGAPTNKFCNIYFQSGNAIFNCNDGSNNYSIISLGGVFSGQKDVYGAVRFATAFRNGFINDTYNENVGSVNYTNPNLLKLGVTGSTVHSTFYFSGTIKTILVYPTLLTDEHCIRLIRVSRFNTIAPFRKRPIRRYWFLQTTQQLRLYSRRRRFIL